MTFAKCDRERVLNTMNRERHETVAVMGHLFASASQVAEEQLLQVWPGGAAGTDLDGKHSCSHAAPSVRPTCIPE